MRKFRLWLCAAAGALCALDAAADPVTTLTGEFSETHSRVDCGECGPIVWTQNFTITLSGGNAIHERWSGRSNRNLTSGGERDGQLGQTANRATWRVLGPHRLERTIAFTQHFMTMTFNTEGGACRVNVAFHLKPGFSDMYAPRRDTHEWTHFTLPQPVSASCEIH